MVMEKTLTLSKEILYPKEEIDKIVERIADGINLDFENSKFVTNELFFLGVLNGCCPFIGDLVKRIDKSIPIIVDYVQLSSYGKGTKSSGSIKIIKPLTFDIRQKDIIIVEDIVDTALTTKFLIEFLHLFRPKSIGIAAAFIRAGAEKKMSIDYPGAIMNHDKFVVGYGMDHNGYYRNLDYVGYMET